MNNDEVERLRRLAAEQRAKTTTIESSTEGLVSFMLRDRSSSVLVSGVERTKIEGGKYVIVFGREACDLARLLFGDENSFHDPAVDSNAIVPGALIIGAVGGAVANFLPERRLRRFTIEFVRPVPVGGTAFLTLQRLPDERHWSVLSAVLCNAEGKPICSPTTIYLEKKKEE